MAKGPLDDAIAVLSAIKAQHPELNTPTFAFGMLQLTFRDGVVIRVGPHPELVRGKDFHLSTWKVET